MCLKICEKRTNKFVLCIGLSANTPLTKRPPFLKHYLLYKTKKKVIYMQIINRKELSGFQTSFLIKLKHTILRRIEIEKQIDRTHTRMLYDVLSELDNRKLSFSS